MRLKMKIRAPKKPSVLIQMGLTDMRAVERLKRYEIRMSSYHAPIYPDVCYVCLAGSIIVRRSNVKRTHSAGPDDFNGPWHNCLVGLDEIRKGHIISGCHFLGIEHHNALDNLEHKMDKSYVSYENDAESFKRWLATLITELRKVGL